MLDADEVAALTGHPVGGVCPFGLATPLPVYCDVSLRAFDTVFPAAGSRTSSVRIAPARLVEITGAAWIDACRLEQAPTTGVQAGCAAAPPPVATASPRE